MLVTFDPHTIFHALQGVLPRDLGRISLHEPRFSGNERAYIKECLDVTRLHNLGWRSKTSLREGLTATYKDFLENSTLRK